MASPEAVKYFETIVRAKPTIKAMLDQAARTNPKFPLKSIEHIFIPKKGKTYCRYCGYNIDNLFHK